MPSGLVVKATPTVPSGVASIYNYNTEPGALGPPINTEIVKKSFGLSIQWLLPKGDATLLGLTSKTKSEIAAQIEHGFYAKVMVFPSFTVNALASNVATTLTAYDASEVIPNGLYRIVGTTTGGAGALTPAAVLGEEVVWVQAVAGNTLTVVRGTGAASIPVDSTFVHAGNAATDSSLRPASFLTKEIRMVNYTQIFRNTWMLSGTVAAIQNLIGDSNPAKAKHECFQYHAMDIEKSFIFGQRFLSNGTVGVSNAFRTMGGIISQITDPQAVNLFLPGQLSSGNIVTANSSVSGTPTVGALSITDFENWADNCANMSYTPESALSRTLIVGKEAHKVINRLLRFHQNYEVYYNEMAWGLRYTTITLTRVTLHLIEHPLFNTNLQWARLALIVDIPSLQIAYMTGRKTKEEMFNQKGIAVDNGIDAEGGSLLSELTMLCRNPAGCGLMTNITKAVNAAGTAAE